VPDAGSVEAELGLGAHPLPVCHTSNKQARRRKK
jgi:hypothetical protein